jgi:hypothetical protein
MFLTRLPNESGHLLNQGLQAPHIPLVWSLRASAAVVTPGSSRSASPSLHGIESDKSRMDVDSSPTLTHLPPVIDSSFVQQRIDAAWAHFIHEVSLLVLIQQSQPFKIRSVPTDDYMSAVPLPRNLEQNVFTLYNRAFEFVVLQNDIVLPAIWLQCVDVVFIVFSFNHALGRQMMAVRNESNEMYRQVQVAYMGTYARLQRLVSNNQYKSEYDILFMALLNNLGHCHAALEEPDAAMQCFNALYFMFRNSSQRHRLTVDGMSFYEARMTLGCMVRAPKPAPAA